MTHPLLALQDLGQSPWLDNIHRALLDDGTLAAMVEAGEVTGLTSNPTIFEQAIARGDAYDQALAALVAAGRSAEQIVDTLTIQDIRRAADILLPVFRRSAHRDGYVSLEVAPTLAHDTEATVREARRLWRAVRRQNLMVKVPATRAGLPAITECIAAGINVNVTLIFSLERYAEVIDAYLAGLERRQDAGMPLDRIASVASFFVSRVDTVVDGILEERLRAASPEQRSRLERLRGTAAIALAKLAYQRFRSAFTQGRFARLVRDGARVQRPLWASTSTKNPAYPDTYYVEALVGPDTVNTMPPHTLAAYRAHGQPACRIEHDLDRARQVLLELHELGIDLKAITTRLETEGVAAFARSWAALLAVVGMRREALRQQARVRLDPPRAAATVGRALDALQDRDPQELGIPASLDVHSIADTANRLRAEVQAAGITRVIAVGEPVALLPVLAVRSAFAPARGGLELVVGDARDIGSIQRLLQRHSPRRTLWLIVGTTADGAFARSLLETLWSILEGTVGPETGSQCVALAAPGSALEQLAHERHFRHVLGTARDSAPGVGLPGLLHVVPLALLGHDVAPFLDRAHRMAAACTASLPRRHNPAAVLATTIDALTAEHRRTAAIMVPPRLRGFGQWLAHLLAIRSVDAGAPLLPVVGDPVSRPGDHGSTALFLRFHLGAPSERAVVPLPRLGNAAITVRLADAHDLGAETVRWSLALGSLARPEAQRVSLADSGPSAARGPANVEVLPATAPDLVPRILAALAASPRPGTVLLLALVARSTRHDMLLGALRERIQERSRRPTVVGTGLAALETFGPLIQTPGLPVVPLVLTSGPHHSQRSVDQSPSLAELEVARALALGATRAAAGQPWLHVDLGEQPATGFAALLAGMERRQRPPRSARRTVARSRYPGRPGKAVRR